MMPRLKQVAAHLARPWGMAHAVVNALLATKSRLVAIPQLRLEGFAALLARQRGRRLSDITPAYVSPAALRTVTADFCILLRNEVVISHTAP